MASAKSDWEVGLLTHLYTILTNAFDKKLALELLTHDEKWKICFTDPSFDPNQNNEPMVIKGVKVFMCSFAHYLKNERLDDDETNEQMVSKLSNHYWKDDVIINFSNDLGLGDHVRVSRLVKEVPPVVKTRLFKAIFGALSMIGDEMGDLDHNGYTLCYRFCKFVYDSQDITAIEGSISPKSRLIQIFNLKGYGKVDIEHIKLDPSGYRVRIHTPTKAVYLIKKYGSILAQKDVPTKDDEIIVFAMALKILENEGINLEKLLSNRQEKAINQKLFGDAKTKAYQAGIVSLEFKSVGNKGQHVYSLIGRKDGKKIELAQAMGENPVEAKENAMEKYMESNK